MDDILQKLNDKVINKQGDVGTYADHLLYYLLGNINNLNEEEERALNFILGEDKSYTNYERYINFENRKYFDTNISYHTHKHYEQGVKECMTWKGKHIFKTTADLCILQMLLWELKPKTIIEIGSGNGASAEYMNDLLKVYEIDSKIYSFDIRNESKVVQDTRINYLHCDVNNLSMFDTYNINYAELPKPWLIVEDAHVNVFGVLYFLNQFVTQGDYFFVEDSRLKQKEIYMLMQMNQNLKLDTKYLDFFGFNNTSACNSILKYT